MMKFLIVIYSINELLIKKSRNVKHEFFSVQLVVFYSVSKMSKHMNSVLIYFKNGRNLWGTIAPPKFICGFATVYIQYVKLSIRCR